MKKEIVFVLGFCLMLSGLSATSGFGAEEKLSVMQKIKNAYNNYRSRNQPAAVKAEAPKVNVPKAAAAQPKVVKAEMTKEEMLAELQSDITENEDILDILQDLKAVTEPDGKTTFAYRGVALEQLSKNELAGLYNLVRQNITKMRTERIQRQLDTVKQVERLQKSSTPQLPPRVITPPVPPRAISAPPSVPRVQTAPRIPTLPPSAPSRR